MNLPVEKRRQWIASRRQQRKLTKLARLRRQALRYSILSALLFAGGIAFYKIHWMVSNKDKQPCIAIKGNFVASDDQIRQVLESSINLPIFSLNPEDLEKKVESLSVIRRAFIRRYALPHPKLQVEILEEFPWATFYADPDSPAQFVVAESGKLIPIANFPHVFQPALKIYGHHKESLSFNAENVSQWANWIAYIEKQMQCPVLAIDMNEANDIKVETSKFTLALGQPDNSLSRRLYRLASVLDVMASEHKEPIYVNLGLNSNIPIKLANKIDLEKREARN